GGVCGTHPVRRVGSADSTHPTIAGPLSVSQPCLSAGLKILDLDLNAAPTLPFVDARRKDYAALAAGGHQFLRPLAQTEGDGPQRRTFLAHAEAKVSLPAADAPRLA